MVPPDYLSIDQGSAYISKEMGIDVEAAGIKLEEAPIATLGSIRILELYHLQLRTGFKKLQKTLEKDKATDEEYLMMVVYATNSTMGPEGLFTMLLQFGALPFPALTTTSPNQ